MRTCKHTGAPLPPNLYNDPKGRPEKYTYKTPAGTFVTIDGYKEAVRRASKANAQRANVPGKRYSLRFWLGEYLEFCERQTPGLEAKASWRQRKGELRRFVDHFAGVRTDKIEIATLAPWWNELTFDQQHNRRSAHSKFFVYLMGQGVAKCNPFNSNDDAARLMTRGKPSKRRLPLHEPEFWAVYEHAEQFLRDAMIISLATTLRRGDVINLRFDHVVEGALRVTVGKSVGQRGFARASHLSWNLDDHEALRDVVNAARERSLSLKRCPYIVAHKPGTSRERRGSDHPYKVRGDAITKAFAKARNASGLWDNIAPGRMAPSFHEIRGLAIERFIAAGADLREVQRLAAHTDESVTSGYAANHAPEYEVVRLATPVKIPG